METAEQKGRRPARVKRIRSRREKFRAFLTCLLVAPLGAFLGHEIMDAWPGGRTYLGAAYSPDGRSLALVSTTRSGRDYVELRDAQTLDVKWRQRLKSFASQVVFSPDGQYIATPLPGRRLDPDTLCILPVAGGEPRICEIQHPEQHRWIRNVIGLGAGSQIACMFSDGIEIFDAADGGFVRHWEPRTHGYLAYAYSLDEDRLALVSTAHPSNPRMYTNVQVWNVSERQRECEVVTLSDDWWPRAAAGGDTVACVMPDLGLSIFRACPPEPVASLDLDIDFLVDVNMLVVSPDGRSVAVNVDDYDGQDRLLIYDIESGRCLMERPIPYTEDSPVFTPDSRRVLILEEGCCWTHAQGKRLGGFRAALRQV